MPVTASALAAARDALAAAFDGGAPVELTADGAVLPRPEARDTARCGHPDAAAVVRTSGSTGTPKQIVLTAPALRASADATARRLAEGGRPGTGHWLLAVGTQYVAGLAVLSRSLLAGTSVAPLPEGPFTPAAFAAGTAALPDDGARLVSLVPTQLTRLLAADADPAGVAALRTFDHVLVGGARLAPQLRAAADAAGVHLTATYGMAETCGGCVYDGVPLPGVTADLVPSDPADRSSTPRVRLAGPTVAAGYLDDPARTAGHFRCAPGGGRAFLTEDTGTVVRTDEGGVRLAVTGRLDDVVVTGGLKVSAAAVAATLESHPAVAAAHVAGAPDPEWGQRLCAAVVPAGPPAHGVLPAGLEAALRALVRDALGPAAVPKTWLALDALPLLPTGKTDRQALTARFEAVG